MKYIIPSLLIISIGGRVFYFLEKGSHEVN